MMEKLQKLAGKGPGRMNARCELPRCSRAEGLVLLLRTAYKDNVVPSPTGRLPDS